MTIASTEAFRSGPYDGNGATTVFDYEFTIFAPEDVTLTRRNVNGTQTELVLSTDYSVQGAGTTGGGAVTLVSGDRLPTGTTLVITSNIALTQDRPFSSQSSLSLEEIELALDKLTTLVRRQQEQLNRAMTVPVDSTTSTQLAALPVVGASIVFNADGNLSVGPTSTQIANAQGDAEAAAASSLRASEWSDKAEDVEVVAGRFSALHWAAKAEEYASILAGRNLIINGSGRINQRGYVSGTATTGANQFTLDRWFVVTSGQNLTFTGTAAGRTMTAPAGGVGQVVEGSNVVGGTYVLNWTGTATATVNGVARAKGEAFTLTAGANVALRLIGGTYGEVQLERGTVVTPFEYFDIATETARCFRYFELGTGGIEIDHLNFRMGITVPFKVRKRASPAVSVNNQDVFSQNVNVTSGAAISANPDAAHFEISKSSDISAGSRAKWNFGFSADAELTS